jgi:tRNA(adenine34) deaminase
MHYELFMSAAIGEARAALDQGERPHGAAAVLGEALVASAHEEVAGRGDPTAHAVLLTLREAAQRLGTRSLAGLTVFATVYAVADPAAGAAGSVVQLANHPALPRRVDLISGILRADAAELLERAARRPA